MARAFFYAGARALLVSHWAVDSDATVKLITKTLSTMAADKTIGRSEALRRSMVALIEQGEAHEAHPAYWAPFVVVGEGSTSACVKSASDLVHQTRSGPSFPCASPQAGEDAGLADGDLAASDLDAPCGMRMKVVSISSGGNRCRLVPRVWLGTITIRCC